MKLFNKIALLTMLIITCMVGSTSSLYSQNETGTRNLNDTLYKATHRWYDSTTAMFQHQFPIIRSIPPLNTSMPLDVLISYIYLDSLLRSPLASTLNQKLESWTTLNDTLTYAAKALFTLKDYNPIILNQYANEVGLQQSSSGNRIVKVGGNDWTTQSNVGKYRTSLTHLMDNIAFRMHQILKSDTSTANIADACLSVLFSDYIIRVKVVNIDSTLNKHSPVNEYRYNVTAQVLDTIVGKIIPALSNNTQYINHLQNKKIISNDSSTHYTTLQYIKQNYYPNGYKEDSSFIESELKHNFKLSPGQELIMFLSFNNRLYDNQNDYFDIDLAPSASYNALPIIAGNVRDVNKIWSEQTIISYEQWIAIVQNVIAKIKSTNY